MIRSASDSVSAIGFSSTTCLPARSAATAEIRPRAAGPAVDHGVDIRVSEHLTQVAGCDRAVPAGQRRRGGRVTADDRPQLGDVVQLGQCARMDLGDHPGPHDGEPQPLGHAMIPRSAGLPLPNHGLAQSG